MQHGSTTIEASGLVGSLKFTSTGDIRVYEFFTRASRYLLLNVCNLLVFTSYSFPEFVKNEVIYKIHKNEMKWKDKQEIVFFNWKTE